MAAATYLIDRKEESLDKTSRDSTLVVKYQRPLLAYHLLFFCFPDFLYGLFFLLFIINLTHFQCLGSEFIVSLSCLVPYVLKL